MGLKKLVRAWAQGFEADTNRLKEEAAKLRQLNDRRRSENAQIRAETTALQQQLAEMQESGNEPVDPQEKTLSFRFAKDVLELETKIRALRDPALQELGREGVYRLSLPLANNAEETSFLEKHLGPGRTF